MDGFLCEKGAVNLYRRKSVQSLHNCFICYLESLLDALAHYHLGCHAAGSYCCAAAKSLEFAVFDDAVVINIQINSHDIATFCVSHGAYAAGILDLYIPVFHDDQHGTAIVVTAALINALRVVGKKMEDVHIVLNGPGAAGTAIIKMLMTAGAKDIVAVDQFGTLYKGCNSAEAHKNWLGEVTNPRQIKGGLKEAIEGADVFIGVSRPGILTTELCKTMNKDAIVFAMANPTPEIMPDDAKAGGVRVMATGRSDFPNQVNNVLCFPGLFKGALSVRARDINDQMKLAAAYAIADLITDADRSEENIIPGAFDPRVAEAVAAAVAKAARETGVARL